MQNHVQEVAMSQKHLAQRKALATEREEGWQPAVGSWVREADAPAEPMKNLWLVVHKGLNYFQIEMPGKKGGYHSRRVHVDKLNELEPVETAEAKRLIEQSIARTNEELASEMQSLHNLLQTHDVRMIASSPEETCTALAKAGDDPKEQVYALSQVTEKRIPEIEKRVKNLGEQLEALYGYSLVEMHGYQRKLECATQAVDRKLHAVRLYVGLSEHCKCVRDGAPASDGKIAIFRQRLYMDEECVAAYRTGGITFERIKDFERWLSEEENFSRILPMPRSIVAFRVRRSRREWHNDDPLEMFVRIRLDDADKLTFLYIRDGQRLWRLSTEHDFGETLFPDSADPLYGGKLYVDYKWSSDCTVLTEREYKERCRGIYGTHDVAPLNYETVYLEDGLHALAMRALEYNKFALILQGILDRGTFHGLPRIQLYNPEQFNRWIELIDDYGHCLNAGPEPDFETYRDALSKLITSESVLTGQRDYWMRKEAEKEVRRQERDWRCKHVIRYERFQPYGDPGPPDPAVPTKITRRGARFEWKRQSRQICYYDHSPVKCGITVPLSELVNVTAYKPGDFKKFYADPRTRRKYIQWAHLLLAAEEWKEKK